MGGYALGHIQHHPDAQAFQHLKQLAPVHGLPAAFHLAQKVLADADAAGGIVLADLLCLAAGADYRPILGASWMGICMASSHDREDFGCFGSKLQ